jgi:hypothetical protein
MKLFRFQSNQPYMWPQMCIQPVSTWNLDIFRFIAVWKLRSTPDIDNYQQCLYTRLACKNPSSIQNELFSKTDFTFFLNWLKLSNFFIFKGKHLYNLTPMCSTLFWSKYVLWECVWRSDFLLALCSWISRFCLRPPLYFFMKHKTSKNLHWSHCKNSIFHKFLFTGFVFSYTYN